MRMTDDRAGGRWGHAAGLMSPKPIAHASKFVASVPAGNLRGPACQLPPCTSAAQVPATLALLSTVAGQRNSLPGCIVSMHVLRSCRSIAQTAVVWVSVRPE